MAKKQRIDCQEVIEEAVSDLLMNKNYKIKEGLNPHDWLYGDKLEERAEEHVAAKCGKCTSIGGILLNKGNPKKCVILNEK